MSRVEVSSGVSRVATAAMALVVLMSAMVLMPSALAQEPTAIVISELFYNPDGPDESTEFVELHNTAAMTVDVSGWTIGGVGARLGVGTTIIADGYLVVARDGANFSAMFGRAPDEEFTGALSNGGETITLSDAEGALVDSVQYDDVSPWPIGPDGDGPSLQLLDSASDNALASSWGQGDPTPGMPNQAVPGRPATPTASIGRGVHNAAVSETLSSATPGAQIRYTLDGSAPSAQSVLYTGPFQIALSNRGDQSMITLRAVSIANGQTSLESAHTYLYSPGLIAAGYDQLPTVSVQTNDRTMPTCVRAQPTICTREAASIDYIDPGDGAGFGVTAGIAVFGDSSVDFPKTSFRLYFDDEWGVSNLKYPVFDGYGQGFIEPTETFDKLELRAQSWDGPFDGARGPDYYVSDRWWKDTVLDLGSLSPHGRFVNVFMNGRYHGVYDLRERFDSKWFESYGQGDSSEYDSVKWDGASHINAIISIDEGTTALWDRVRAAASYQQVKGWINPVALVHQEMVDSLTLSDGVGEREYRFVGGRTADHPDDAILMHSDNDMAFGLQGSWWTWAPAGPGLSHLGWLSRWSSDAEFRQIILDETAWAFCGDGPLTAQASVDRLNEWAGEVELTMNAETARWGATSFTAAISTARSRVTSGMPQLQQAWQAAGLFVGCDRSPQLTGPADLVAHRGQQVALPLGFSDPDGDLFTISAPGLPAGLSISSDGVISGVATAASGDYVVEVRAEDSRGRWRLHEVMITIVDGGSPVAAPALVLNEYNAVDADVGVWAGSDPAFPNDPANGGDWFELVTTEDDLDLRGWSIELWDRDRDSERLKRTDTYVFADDLLWRDLRAGTLITIAESVGQDASYSPQGGDWSVTVSPTGGLVLGGSGFDTNRRGFRITVRDDMGNLVGPVMGETEQWRAATGVNVSAEETLALCVTPGPEVDLVGGFDAQAEQSTFASPNICDDGATQDLDGFRPLVGPPGDVDGSGEFDASDVQTLLERNVGNSVDVFNVRAADLNDDGVINLLDALLAAQQLN